MFFPRGDVARRLPRCSRPGGSLPARRLVLRRDHEQQFDAEVERAALAFCTLLIAVRAVAKLSAESFFVPRFVKVVLPFCGSCRGVEKFLPV